MISASELRTVPQFSSLPDAEASALTARLADVHLREGDWLLHEGEQPSFFMLINGEIEVRKMVHGADRRINVYQPGDYFGELPLLLGSPAVASLRALQPSRVARLDPADFTELFGACASFSAELTQTMTQRFSRLRTLMSEAPPPQLTIVGHRYDIACHQLRDFLVRNRLSFRWLDPTRPSLRGDADPPRPGDRYPVVIMPDGERLETPTLRELADKLGLKTHANGTLYDVAIVGGGPAGLAAAVYGASEGLRTLLIEREAPGGQAGTSTRIENYLGFPSGLSGDELGTRALQQAQRFGAEILVAREVVGLDVNGSQTARAILLDGGDRIRARTLILANGVKWRELELPSADALLGRGIYYGAARSEAMSCAGEDVFLVGGGNSAGQAAIFFANYARKITLLVRGKSLDDSMSHYLIQQLSSKDNIEVRTRSRMVRVKGEQHLEAVAIENRDSGEVSVEPAAAVFVLIGADAKTEWLPPQVIRDQVGYICTGRDVMDLLGSDRGGWPLERDPYLLETSVPGVFAAGDVRHGSVKRVASGVGEGSMAIAFVHQFLATAT
ncbi:MAG: cyclic nucleotide-binding domain-containing protein [Betaproteobacteria bacterium]|nr:MAG: cyclic nucleotide-binding domain-containing protein [Betaproteobacteria bacterium]